MKKSKKALGTASSPSLPSDELLDDENDEEGEEAQADAEEYANMSLIEVCCRIRKIVHFEKVISRRVDALPQRNADSTPSDS